MRHARLLLVLTLAVGTRAPLQAQMPDWVNEVLMAARLPVVTTEARREGIPDSSIFSVLDAMKKARIPASEASVVLDSARAAHRDNGPVGNFGAFVQSQLAAGKRGTALAAAIRAEHARVGRGRRAGRGNDAKGRGQDAGGNAANASRGRSGAQSQADSAGRGAGNRGRGRPPQPQS